MRKLFWLLVTLPAVLHGYSMPSGLAPTDIDRATRLLVMGGTTKLMRSAESYPIWPGIKIALEFDLLQGGAAASLGNQDGSIGAILPAPRIYLCKSVLEGVELIFSGFPATLNTIGGAGGLAKWTLFSEKDHPVAFAVYGGISGVSAFQGELQGAVIEVGAITSKDYVRLKPYFGLSLMFAKGQVLPALAAATTTTGMLLGSHMFLGAEFELPVNLTAQIDLFGLNPALSVSVGKKF